MACARGRLGLVTAVIFLALVAGSTTTFGRDISTHKGTLHLDADAVWKISESIYVNELTVADPASIVADTPVFVFYARASENIAVPRSVNVHGELAVGNVTYVPVLQMITIENEAVEKNFTDEALAGSLIVLKNATLTGRLDGVSLSLDDTSAWNVTGDSRLVGADLNRADLDRVYGNGHEVLFDGEVALSADLREFPEELNGEDKYMESGGGNILMPVLPENVELQINSPCYVDGGASDYAGAISLTDPISVTVADAPLNNSAIYVKNRGKVIARGSADVPYIIEHTSQTNTVYEDGTNRSQDAMMKMGVSSIAYANAGGEVVLDNFRASGTTNGLYAIYGGVVRASNGVLTTSSLHGVQICFGGKIALKDMEVHTTGQQGSVLSSDFGGGWLVAENVTGSSQTTGSAGIYCDGYSYFYVSNSDLTAYNDSAAVLCAGGEMTLSNTVLKSGGTSRSGEVNAVVYVHPNGNNPRRVSNGYFTGCTFIGEGDVFYVDGKSTNIVLKGQGTTVQVPTGARLVYANNIAPGAMTLDQAWPLDANASTFTLSDVVLSGDAFVEPDGTRLSLVLEAGTEYTGAITRAAVTVRDGAVWSLAGDSMVTEVGFTSEGIRSNGFDIYYDAGLAANSVLGGKSYDLPGGGTLLPLNVITIENSEMAADHSGEMYTGDTLLVLTNSTLTGELRGVRLAMDENSTWNVTGNSSLEQAELRNQVVVTDGGVYTGTVNGADMTVADGGWWQVTEDASVVNLSVEYGGQVTADRTVTVSYGASENVDRRIRGNVTYVLDEDLLPPQPVMDMGPPAEGGGAPPEGGPGGSPNGPPGGDMSAPQEMPAF
jgi:hypothetical protein